MRKLGKMAENRSFYEFFAGGGMARAGLGPEWSCLFANDINPMKARTYIANWGDDHFVEGDVAKIGPNALPKRADLVWASFPCQDLSLAGKYQGLGDATAEIMTRSGVFWPFWALIEQLCDEGRRPCTIVLENVAGAITSRNGKDFEAICDALARAGYRYGALTIDASHFVPQSRPRLFFVAVAKDVNLCADVVRPEPSADWCSEALQIAQRKLQGASRGNWVWWDLPSPPIRDFGLGDIIEGDPSGCRWHSDVETNQLLAMMVPLHLAKIETARASGRRLVGAVYKRTRLDGAGRKQQRAEVRFDDTAGCLRTPGGGSSRQTIVVVEGDSIRSRLLSTREAARLMGLDDSYILPTRYNDAYHVAGDGVCVPVVRFIAANLIEPILDGQSSAIVSKAA